MRVVDYNAQFRMLKASGLPSKDVTAYEPEYVKSLGNGEYAVVFGKKVPGQYVWAVMRHTGGESYEFVRLRQWHEIDSR